jgi:hypothetical protein
LLKETNLRRLKKDPYYLYRMNYIGNPSCTLYRKNLSIPYDKQFKWVVDYEFYMRYLSTTGKQPVYIPQPLIQVGVNDTQVTTYTFRVPDVEIPENHLMLEKQGFHHLTNIYIYDYFWRLYRNLNITSVSQLAQHGYSGQLPPVLMSMIRFQSRIFKKVLLFGPASKTLMLLHYLQHRHLLKN